MFIERARELVEELRKKAREYSPITGLKYIEFADTVEKVLDSLEGDGCIPEELAKEVNMAPTHVLDPTEPHELVHLKLLILEELAYLDVLYCD